MKELPELPVQPKDAAREKRPFAPSPAGVGGPAESVAPIRVPAQALQHPKAPTVTHEESAHRTEPTESQIGLALRSVSPVSQPPGLRAHRERRAGHARYHDDPSPLQTSHPSSSGPQQAQTVPLAIDRSNSASSAWRKATRPGQQKPRMVKPPPPPLEEHRKFSLPNIMKWSTDKHSAAYRTRTDPPRSGPLDWRPSTSVRVTGDP